MKKIKMLFVAIAALSCGLAYGQDITVTGVVTDGATGEPLSGAAILVKGTPRGVVADNDGRYSIVVSPDATLGYTTIGFMDVEEKVNGRAVINVALQPDAELLNEVVVTAMGISREKKALGYAVQDVKSEVLTQAAATSLSSAIQGKLSGVDIVSSSGMPGASAKIVIRGARSLDGNNTPLYVIDGMPVASTPDMGTGDSVTG